MGNLAGPQGINSIISRYCLILLDPIRYVPFFFYFFFLKPGNRRRPTTATFHSHRRPHIIPDIAPPI